MQATRKRTRWAWTVATWFGIGFLKPGPGTYGSIAAVLLWLAAGRWIGVGPHAFLLLIFVAVILITAVGIPASTIVAREAATEDPGFVVVDEVAGQWLALLAFSPTCIHAALGLALFRLFDIWKPWPIRELEALDGGTGIMLDDLGAGLLALIIAQLLTHFVPALR
jgi:phosphatidylglycerophosphatase A